MRGATSGSRRSGFEGPNLIQVVMSALAGAGLAAQRLELEITESVLLLAGDTTLATPHQFRKMGVRRSMDDFGTGSSRWPSRMASY
jgi:EAL domain-containing protein (putative c-di-GMP-specific phosphodiesterase class I)